MPSKNSTRPHDHFHTKADKAKIAGWLVNVENPERYYAPELSRMANAELALCKPAGPWIISTTAASLGLQIKRKRTRTGNLSRSITPEKNGALRFDQNLESHVAKLCAWMMKNSAFCERHTAEDLVEIVRKNLDGLTVSASNITTIAEGAGLKLKAPAEKEREEDVRRAASDFTKAERRMENQLTVLKNDVEKRLDDMREGLGALAEEFSSLRRRLGDTETETQ